MPNPQPTLFNASLPSAPLATLGQSFQSPSASPSSHGPPQLPLQTIQNGSPQNQTFGSSVPNAAPQLPPAQASSPLYSTPPAPMYAHKNNSSHSSLPPLKPVFGVSLEDLLIRDGSAIPPVVYQCIQAVDLYGLDVEGIYRLSGSATHVSKLKAQFDHGTLIFYILLSYVHGQKLSFPDSSQVDFRNPEAFYHDVNSVVGLLKQFFRDLPDPLMTREHYQNLVEAARMLKSS